MHLRQPTQSRLYCCFDLSQPPSINGFDDGFLPPVRKVRAFSSLRAPAVVCPGALVRIKVPRFCCLYTTTDVAVFGFLVTAFTSTYGLGIRPSKSCKLCLCGEIRIFDLFAELEVVSIPDASSRSRSLCHSHIPQT